MTALSSQWSPAAKLLIILASLVIVIAGMRYASILLVPLFMAIFISIIISPLFFFLQRCHVPAWLALLLLILLLLLFATVGVGLLEYSLRSVINNLPIYQQILKDRTLDLFDWLKTFGVVVPKDLAMEVFDAGAAFGFVRNLLSSLTAVLGQAFLIILLVIFIMLEVTKLPERIKALPNTTEESWERLGRIILNVRQYMSMKTLMSILTGALVSILLFAIDVDFAFLLGVLAFLLNYIPTIGSFLAGVPGVFLALIQHDVTTALIALGGYVVINIGVSNGIEPKLMGQSLGISPLVVMATLFFWGWVLGPVGMLLAVPLTMAVKVAMESDQHTSWMALLMNAEEDEKTEKR